MRKQQASARLSSATPGCLRQKRQRPEQKGKAQPASANHVAFARKSATGPCACSGATTGNLPISEGANKPSNLMQSHSRVKSFSFEANLSVARLSQQWTRGVAGSFSSPARTGGTGRCPELGCTSHVAPLLKHLSALALGRSGSLAAAGAKHTKKPKAATRTTLGRAKSRQEKGSLGEPKSD